MTLVTQFRQATSETAEGSLVEKGAWYVVTSVAAFAAAWAARKAATAVWSRFRDKEGPVNPADRSVTWGAAAAWAVLAGVAGGVGRLLARRGSAAAWQQVTGDTSPGLEVA
jgi:hypothetical protein